MATNLSQRILNLQEKESQKIKSLINSVLTSESLQKVFERNNLFELMSSDKKKKGDKLNFILLNSIGSAETVSDIKDSDILESIKLI